MTQNAFERKVLELWTACDDRMKHADTSEPAQMLNDLLNKHLPALAKAAEARGAKKAKEE